MLYLVKFAEQCGEFVSTGENSGSVNKEIQTAPQSHAS